MDDRAAKWLRTLTFLAFQGLATLLLFEGALRLLRPHHAGLDALLFTPSVATDFDEIPTLEVLMRDTFLGWVPHQKRRGFVLNSRSMRTAEYAGENAGGKSFGAYRIMVIGDSFTFASGGVPYPQMFTVRMREELQRSGALGEVEVFELGVPGVGPRFELRLWELEHDLVDPDLVILAFFVGNDFTDETLEAEETTESDVEIRLERWSYSYRLLHNLRLVWRLRKAVRLSESDQQVHQRGGYDVGLEPDQVGPLIDRPQWYLELEAERLEICLKPQRERFRRLAADVGAVLGRFAEEVREAGAEFLVVIIPDEVQVDPELRRRVLEHLRASPEDVDLDLPQRHLAGLLNEAGIPYLDLLPLFRERTEEGRLYWPNDSHWNPEGNALAGKALAEFLLARQPSLRQPSNSG